MGKKIWGLYAPVYESVIRADGDAYQGMYALASKAVEGKDVLEIATGPGVFAKHIAQAAHSMIATDYAEGMIREAEKGSYPEQLTFEIADATALPYADQSFDVVLIANALHVIQEPEQALKEISRVMKPDCVLVAPNYVNHRGSFISRLLLILYQIAGIRFEHRWTEKEYMEFLENHGWKVRFSKTLKARIPIAYVEFVKRND